DHVEYRFEPAARIAGTASFGLLPAPPKEGIAVLEPGGDERVLRREMAIEAHLRDPRTRDDRIDADRANPLAVKHLRGGVEDALPHRRPLLSPAHCASLPPLTRQTCLSHRRGPDT